MKRREFMALMGGAAAVAAWPTGARAQGPKAVSRLGILTIGPAGSPIDDALLHGLRDLGYVEGQNLIVDFRSAAGQPERVAEFAAELTAAKVDVIFASGSQATAAAQRATTIFRSSPLARIRWALDSWQAWRGPVVTSLA